MQGVYSLPCQYPEITDQKKDQTALFRIIIIFTLLAAVVACSSLRFPGVHRITIQQGNVITQQMIDKLRPGMTRRQVRFVLGNPVIDDSLDRDRWDYVYTIQIADNPRFQRLLSVYFVEERLSHFEGGYLPSEHSPTSDG